jgi:hypothetical protein
MRIIVSHKYFCCHRLCAYSFFGPRHIRRRPPGSTPPVSTASPLLSPLTTCSNPSFLPPCLMQLRNWNPVLFLKLCPRHQLPNATQHVADAAGAVHAGWMSASCTQGPCRCISTCAPVANMFRMLLLYSQIRQYPAYMQPCLPVFSFS